MSEFGNNKIPRRFLLLDNNISIGIFVIPESCPQKYLWELADCDFSQTCSKASKNVIIALSPSGKYTRVLFDGNVHSFITKYAPKIWSDFIQETVHFRNKCGYLGWYPFSNKCNSKNKIADNISSSLKSTFWTISDAENIMDDLGWKVLAKDTLGHFLSICPTQRRLRLRWSIILQNNIAVDFDYKSTYLDFQSTNLASIESVSLVDSPSEYTRQILAALKAQTTQNCDKMSQIEIKLNEIDNDSSYSSIGNEIDLLDAIVPCCFMLANEQIVYPENSCLHPRHISIDLDTDRQSGMLMVTPMSAYSQCHILHGIFDQFVIPEFRDGSLTKRAECFLNDSDDSSIVFSDDSFVTIHANRATSSITVERAHYSFIALFLQDSTESESRVESQRQKWSLIQENAGLVRKLILFHQHAVNGASLNYSYSHITESKSVTLKSKVYRSNKAKYTVLYYENADASETQDIGLIHKIRGLFENHINIEYSYTEKIFLAMLPTGEYVGFTLVDFLSYEGIFNPRIADVRLDTVYIRQLRNHAEELLSLSYLLEKSPKNLNRLELDHEQKLLRLSRSAILANEHYIRTSDIKRKHII